MSRMLDIYAQGWLCGLNEGAAVQATREEKRRLVDKVAELGLTIGDFEKEFSRSPAAVTATYRLKKEED